MTVFCSNCGKPNTDEASKCAACGHELKKGTGAKKFRGTMMMSTPPGAKPPGPASTPGSVPAPAAGSVPPAAGPATSPSVAPVNKNMAFQKTMMGPMVTPPGASIPGSPPDASVPAPIAGPGPGAGAPLPTPSASPGFGTPRAPSQAGARSPTLLGTAPISPNPQGFSGSPTAETKSSPGTFGLPGPGAYAPPPAQPVAVQPMGQPTAPSGSFGAAPSGSFGQTPTGGGFGQAPQPGSFGQPPAGGFGAPLALRRR